MRGHQQNSAPQAPGATCAWSHGGADTTASLQRARGLPVLSPKLFGFWNRMKLTIGDVGGG